MPAHNNSMRMARRQRGFTLIEALIAFVVLTIGVLGVISLLIMSKNALHQSNQRTLAVNLADTLVERIRINPTAVTDYVKAAPGLGGGTITSLALDCNTNTCTPSQIATFDLWNFEQALDGASVELGGSPVGGLKKQSPHACIAFTADTGKTRSGRLRVDIQWKGLSKTKDGVPTGGTVCGGAAAGTDPYRRQVTVNTIVLDESEF